MSTYLDAFLNISIVLGAVLIAITIVLAAIEDFKGWQERKEKTDEDSGES